MFRFDYFKNVGRGDIFEKKIYGFLQQDYLFMGGKERQSKLLKVGVLQI